MICCLLDFNFPFTFHNCEPQPPSVLWIWMRTFIQQFSAIFAVVIPFLCVCPPVSENKWKAEDDMFWLFLSAWRSGNPLCTDKFPTSTDETFSVFLVNVLVLSGEWKKVCWVGIKQTSFLEVYSRPAVAAVWRRWPDLTNFDVCCLCFLLNRVAFWSLCK